MSQPPRTGGIDRASYWAIIVLAGIWGASRVASSGDLWVALGCGRYILSHGVTRTDPFSFNSIPGDWINQNWLSHVYFTLVERAVGLTGLGIWKFAVTIAIGWLTASTARALGASRTLAAVSAIAIALMGRPFYDVRPNLHTILLSAVLIRWLVGIHDRPISRYWPVPIIFALWANLHGGFLFGIVALIASSGTLTIIRLFLRKEIAGWLAFGILPLLGLLATLASPYGLTNLTHPYIITAGPDAAHWRHVKEWMPPYGPSAEGEIGVRAFWILAATTVAIAIAGTPKTWKRLLVSKEGLTVLPIAAIGLAGLLLSLTSRRFIPLFSAAVIPVLAALAARIFHSAPALGRVRAYLWPASAAVLATVVAATVFPRLIAPNGLWPSAMSMGSRLVRADEQPAEAARFLSTSGARGRVLTGWLWGGYLLYAAPFENSQPLYKIYMDGRAQAAYPASVSMDLDRFVIAAEENDEKAVRSFLDHYRIDFCLIDRREEGVASIIPAMDGWVGVYADEKSLIVSRTARAADLASGVYPNDAIRHASIAFALRTRGTLNREEVMDAFSHAVASVRARPTTTGMTEMTRIALAAPSPLGDSLRTSAELECEAALDRGRLRGTPHEVLSVRANTTRCLAALLQARGDRETAGRLISEANALAARTRNLAKRYIR